MPLANRSTAGNGNGTSVTLNIPVGYGNNRVVVATAAQQRNTVSISSMTLNGVTGTLVGTVTSSDSLWRAFAYIWLDADLPASAGNYTVAVVGAGVDIGIAAIHYSGAAQNSAPAFATNSATSGATSLSLSPTLTSGAVIVQAGTQNTTTTGAGQTNIYASTATTNTFYMSASFDEADNTVSYTMPGSGYAAIAVAIQDTSPAFDARTEYALPGTGQSSSSFSHTVGSGANRLLVVYCVQTTGYASAPSSVTYNGTSMTAMTPMVDGGNGRAVRPYRLLSPATGSNTVAVTWAGNTRGGVVAISFSGVNQTTPFGTEATQTGISTLNVSSAVGETVIDCLLEGSGDSSTLTAGAGQTQRANFVGSTGAGGNSARIGVSMEAGASTVTMSWTATPGGGGSVQHGVSIKPVTFGLAITSVTPSQIDSGESFTITGTGFGATQGLSLVQIGGVTQTPTSWSDTSITCTASRGSQSMGNATLTIYKM